MEKSGNPFDRIRRFFQPSQTTPPKVGPSDNKIKGGFIMRDGKQYYLYLTPEKDLDKSRYSEVLKEAKELLQADPKTNEVVVSIKGRNKTSILGGRVTLKKVETGTERKSKTNTLSRLATTLFLGPKDDPQKSRSDSLKRDLTQLFGTNFPVDENSEIFQKISSDKALFKESQAFLETAIKCRNENLQRLRRGLPPKRNTDLMQKKEALEKSLWNNSISQKKGTSFIQKIIESTGVPDTQPVQDILTQREGHDVATKADFTKPQLERETTAEEKKLIALGFSTRGIEGQYEKFEVKHEGGYDYFILSYANSTGSDIRQVTISLNLLSLEDREDRITPDERQKILDYLKESLKKDPDDVEKWLNDEVRGTGFLGDKFSIFRSITKGFCEQVNVEMGRALLSFGHPELKLIGVTKTTVDALRKEESISRLHINHNYLAYRKNDLTLTDDGKWILKGDLKLANNPSVLSLPEGLKIEGNLEISDCKNLTSIPNDVTVTGTVSLRNCPQLKDFSKELKVKDLKKRYGVDLSDRMGDLTVTENGRLKLKGNLDLSDRGYLINFPEGLDIDGDLNLSGCKNLIFLPRSVSGKLNLSGCISLPSEAKIKLMTNYGLDPSQVTVSKEGKLKIQGDVKMPNHKTLTSLPEGLAIEIEGDLDLSGCENLTSLPQDLKVKGKVNLSNCPQLKSLSKELKVKDLKRYGIDLSGRMEELTMTEDGRLKLKGDLKISPSISLKSFPEGLEIEGNADLSNCINLKSLPKNLKVTGNLILFGCRALKSLPEDIEVGGDLNLNTCNLEALPKDQIKIGGDITLTDNRKLNFLPPWVTDLGAKSNGEKRRIRLEGTKIPEPYLEELAKANTEGITFVIKRS